MKNDELNATLEQIDLEETQLRKQAALEDAKRDLVDRLPMLFTPRGNVKRIRGFRVTANNINALMARMTEYQQATGGRFVFTTEDYTLSVSHDLSAKLIETGVINTLLFTGHVFSYVW